MDNKKYESGKVKLSNRETLNVHVTGTGPNVLIMIHGVWLDHRCFEPLFPYLRDKFSIIAPDFRGHGLSSYEKPVNSIDDFVEDLSLLIDHFELKKVFFFGWCGGTCVALKYASLYPERVEKIIVSSPPGLEGYPLFHGTKGKNKEERIPVQSREEIATHPGLQTLGNAIKEKDRITLSFITTKINFGDKLPSEDTINSLVDQCLLANNVEDLGWAVYTCNLTDRKKWITEGSGAILKVKAKMILFYGDDDPTIPKEAIEQYTEYLGDLVKLKIIEGGGHAVHLLYPKQICEEAIQFCFEQ